MLTALINGDKRSAFEYTAAEFMQLKRSVRSGHTTAVFPSGKRAIPKSGAQTLPHFAHYPGESPAPGTTAPETAYHLIGKEALRRVGEAHGWDMRIEESSEDGAWRADVYGIKGHIHVAFEIQWSRQSDDTYHYRTQRYAADGIGVVWFSRHPVANGDVYNLIPIVGEQLEEYDEEDPYKGHRMYIGGKDFEESLAPIFVAAEVMYQRPWVDDARVHARTHPYACEQCSTPFLWFDASDMPFGAVVDGRQWHEAAEAARFAAGALKGQGSRFGGWACPTCSTPASDFLLWKQAGEDTDPSLPVVCTDGSISYTPPTLAATLLKLNPPRTRKASPRPTPVAPAPGQELSFRDALRARKQDLG